MNWRLGTGPGQTEAGQHVAQARFQQPNEDLTGRFREREAKRRSYRSPDLRRGGKLYSQGV
jgi:hypothetical protein